VNRQRRPIEIYVTVAALAIADHGCVVAHWCVARDGRRQRHDDGVLDVAILRGSARLIRLNRHVGRLTLRHVAGSVDREQSVHNDRHRRRVAAGGSERLHLEREVRARTLHHRHLGGLWEDHVQAGRLGGAGDDQDQRRYERKQGQGCAMGGFHP
jgi:hypothetical protein